MSETAYEDVEQKVQFVIKVLGEKTLSRDSPILNKAMDWVRFLEQDSTYNGLQRSLRDAICKTFNLTDADIVSALSGVPLPKVAHVVKLTRDDELLRILPKGGWFEWCYEYTKETECPLSFTTFSSMCALGAALGRRVYKRMGFFNVYPNYCVVLIGPTGRVKKTTAVDITLEMVKEAALCPVLADAVTPESLLDSLLASGHHFVYAPEFSVLFNKQQYNTGLSTKIIRLLDCPNEHKWKTLKRGEQIVTNVALSILGGTTPSQMNTSMPEEITSSGFLNRFVLVVENDTDRCFPEPPPPPQIYREKMIATLRRLSSMSGEMAFSAKASEWFDEWYRERWKKVRKLEDETEIEVLERAPTHLIRTSMLVHLAQCDDFFICPSCLETAAKMTAFVEKNVASTISGLKTASEMQNTDYILKTLKSLGGATDHSTLLRRVCSKFNAAQFKQQIRTLEEAGRIKVNKKGVATHYVILGGDNVD